VCEGPFGFFLGKKEFDKFLFSPRLLGWRNRLSVVSF